MKRRPDVPYLFRSTPRNVFLTTEDPSFRYEALCGHCDYPVEDDDQTCPRCQRELEDCPVCRTLWHRRAAKDPFAAPGEERVCTICGTLRLPADGHFDLDGSFCTNLFGCSAGGLLLANGELAVLPRDASICPICRHEELRPLPVRVFPHHVQRCPFCLEVFAGDGRESGWSGCETGSLEQGDGSGGGGPCRLCGRFDERLQTGKVLVRLRAEEVKGGEHELTVAQYERVTELGRLLIHESREDHLATRLLDLWGKALHGAQTLTVGRITEILLCGTQRKEIFNILRQRLYELLELWRKNGYDVNFAVATMQEAGDEEASARQVSSEN